jgi:hypothetical protein
MPKSKKLSNHCEENLHKYYRDFAKKWHAVAVRDREFSSHTLCGVSAPRYRLGTFDRPDLDLCVVCNAKILESTLAHVVDQSTP